MVNLKQLKKNKNIMPSKIDNRRFCPASMLVKNLARDIQEGFNGPRFSLIKSGHKEPYVLNYKKEKKKSKKLKRKIKKLLKQL